MTSVLVLVTLLKLWLKLCCQSVLEIMAS